jgi:hypothetical protein
VLDVVAGTGGAGTTGGNGGNLTLQAGAGGAGATGAGGSGGTLEIQAGAAGSSAASGADGGDVEVNAGAGTGTGQDGVVKIGETTTREVQIGGGDRYLQTGTVSTAGATTATAKSFTPDASSVVNVEATIIGLKTDASQAAGYKVISTFRVSGGGTVTQIGSPSMVAQHEDDAAWDATLDTDGTEIRARVTGATGDNIEWKARLKVVTLIAAE